MQIRKTQILINKPVCLGLSILDLSEIVMYEFWFDYVKLKYCENAELCYLPIYKDIVENFEARFKTLNFETDRPLPKGKIKK